MVAQRRLELETPHNETLYRSTSLPVHVPDADGKYSLQVAW